MQIIEKTLKEHTCYRCGQKIPKGSTTFLTHNERGYPMRYCVECTKIELGTILFKLADREGV